MTVVLPVVAQTVGSSWTCTCIEAAMYVCLAVCIVGAPPTTACGLRCTYALLPSRDHLGLYLRLALSSHARRCIFLSSKGATWQQGRAVMSVVWYVLLVITISTAITQVGRCVVVGVFVVCSGFMATVVP